MKKSLAALVLAGMFALLNCDRQGSMPADGAAQGATHNSTSVAMGGVPNPMSSNGRAAGLDSVLSPAMRAALYALAPDFSPYTRNQYDPHFTGYNKEGGDYGLSLVRARLNADSVSDVALLGRGQAVSYFIALLSKPDGSYQAVHVERPIPLDVKDTIGRGISIERQAPGRIDLYIDTGLGRYLTLHSDGIILNIGSEGALIFFLKDGQFVRVGYGD